MSQEGHNAEQNQKLESACLLVLVTKYSIIGLRHLSFSLV